ncbi:zinc ribbon domain-containing protein [Haloarcula hispanica]|uniref:zinc ribbon domain-containing protein n=1 Tax=Haloarcula hispanica TaxID=51589 RepID=UPI001305181E
MAFRPFNGYVACKARAPDITAVRVDPRNTSKRCSMCGFTALGCGIGVERILDSLHPARKTQKTALRHVWKDTAPSQLAPSTASIRSAAVDEIRSSRSRSVSGASPSHAAR